MDSLLMVGGVGVSAFVLLAWYANRKRREVRDLWNLVRDLEE